MINKAVEWKITTTLPLFARFAIKVPPLSIRLKNHFYDHPPGKKEKINLGSRKTAGGLINKSKSKRGNSNM